MIRSLIAAVAPLVVAGCSETMITGSSTAPRTAIALSEPDAELVKSIVRRDLLDPDSARFERMAAGRTPKGTTVVCGWVNAKNSFGGYTGRQPFGGELVGSDYKLVFGGTNYILRAQVQDICGTLGDYYHGT